MGYYVKSPKNAIMTKAIKKNYGGEEARNEKKTKIQMGRREKEAR